MASIRRTLSPANSERHRLNGAAGSSLSISSTHRLFDSSAKSSKKKGFISRSVLYSSFICFALGMVLGFSTSDKVVRESVNSSPWRDNSGDFPPVDLNASDLTVSAISSDVPKGIEMEYYPPKKLLIVVTPTYVRAAQAYFLNRLGQVLALVPPPLLWLIVETGESATGETAELLRKTGVMYRHLVTGSKQAGSKKDRGVHQRNTALEHIEKHRLDGIVYFADDDNAYSLELFDQLREIERFGTWPVAMVAQSKNKAILEGAVCNGSKVIGWHTNEKSKRVRRFHVDMSGFAFNSTILWDPKRWGRFSTVPIRQLDTVKEGFQETTFIWQLVENESQMEGLSNGCSKVLNWHLHLNIRGAFPSGYLLPFMPFLSIQ